MIHPVLFLKQHLQSLLQGRLSLPSVTCCRISIASCALNHLHALAAGASVEARCRPRPGP